MHLRYCCVLAFCKHAIACFVLLVDMHFRCVCVCVVCVCRIYAFHFVVCRGHVFSMFLCLSRAAWQAFSILVLLQTLIEVYATTDKTQKH